MLKREIVPPPEHLYPPDEWRIVEARWTPQFADRAETVFAIANGYLGIRGMVEDGRPTYSPGTFIAGFHETWPIVHAEEAYGLAQVGQTVVNVPDATVMELFVDDEPLFFGTSRLRDYSRVLDMRDGVLTRRLTWSTPSGKHVAVRSSRLVSFEERHLVAMSLEVTVDRAAPVVISSRVVNRGRVKPEQPLRREHPVDPRIDPRVDDHVLEDRVAEDLGTRILLGYRTSHSGMTLGMGVEHVLDVSAPHETVTHVAPDVSRFVVTVDARPGETIRLVKYASYHTSRSVPPESLCERAVRTLDRGVRTGMDGLVAGQRENLGRFWDRADVTVDAHFEAVRVQQAVRWNIFQLAQASWRAEGSGIPAKGLTGAAYGGHYFWDTETYVLPFLAHTWPRIARNLLRFRHSMLPKARERAAELGHRGATFPWRTINGEEASAYYQAGTAQFHLNADIAYSIRRYVDARGDRGFLVEVGAEILVETARLWEDLGFYGDDGCFHIHGVTGPDEYTTVVNDNAFTNLMARLNLNYAAAALRRMRDEEPAAYEALAFDLRLDPSELDAWDRAGSAMYIPYDDALGITPQDDTFLRREKWDLQHTPPENFPLLLHYHPLVIYRHQVLKQADVVMAMFLVGNEFSVEQKRANFAYYDPLTTGDSSLSASIQSIVAAEIGDMKAASRYFDFALLMDLADVAGNASDGVHVASSAGAWMALVFGFGGVRDYDGKLTFEPRLPNRWRSLNFSLRFHDRQLRVSLTAEREVYLVDEGEPLEVTIRGKPYTLTLGEPLEVLTGRRP
jgi:alpha,alpha-trehalose phosphorylase